MNQIHLDGKENELIIVQKQDDCNCVCEDCPNCSLCKEYHFNRRKK